MFTVLLFDKAEKANRLILLAAFAISILVLALVMGILRSLRLEITADGISYTHPIRGTKFILYSEMSSVVLLDYFREGGGVGSSSRSPRRWTLAITPKVETGKAPFKIPLTFFPRDAYNEVMRVLKPEVWEELD
jgi:hypothetical protein